MTDPTPDLSVFDDPQGATGIEPVETAPIEYPDTVPGTLMKQRDQAKASAESDRALSADILRRAAESDARAAQFQAAIDALGGEPTT